MGKPMDQPLGNPMGDLRCAACRELLPYYAAGRLDSVQAAQVARHLAGCAACRAALAQWHAIGSAVRANDERVPPDAGSAAGWSRLQAQLAERTAASAMRTASALLLDEHDDTNSDAHLTLDSIEPSALNHPLTAPRASTHRSRATGIRALPAIAAALLVIVLAGAIFGLLGNARQQRHGNPATATPTSTGCAPDQIHVTFPSQFLAYQLAMVSPDEGWLIGEINGTTPQSVILHYSHCAWRPVAESFTGFLPDSIVMASPTDGWIGGINADGTQPVLLHLVGGTWTQVPATGNPPADTAEGRLLMETGTEGWVTVDHSKAEGHGYFTNTLYHYAGGTWTAVPAPIADVGFLTSTGPDDVWITGEVANTSGGESVIAHYHDGKWSSWTLPNVGVGPLIMQSPADGWAVGTFWSVDSNGLQSSKDELLHFDGTSWQTVPLPSNVPAQQVNLLTPSEGWAFQSAPFDAPGHTSFGSVWQLITHAWELQGTDWQPVAWPFPDIMAISEPQAVGLNEFWATGLAYDPSGPFNPPFDVIPPNVPVLLHYVNGRWYVYGQPPGGSAPQATPTITPEG